MTKLKRESPDQEQRVPNINVAIDEATGDETKPELLSASPSGLSPGETVEALGARVLAHDGKLPIVGLEIELEDLDISGGAEGQIHRPCHSPGGQVRRVRRQRHRGRSIHPFNTRHGLHGRPMPKRNRWGPEI